MVMAKRQKPEYPSAEAVKSVSMKKERDGSQLIETTINYKNRSRRYAYRPIRWAWMIIVAFLILFSVIVTLSVTTPMLSKIGVVGGLIPKNKFVTNVLGKTEEDRNDALWQYYTANGRDSVVTRDNLIARIMAVDSLEREVMMWQIYAQNIFKILQRSKEGIINVDSTLTASVVGMSNRTEVASYLDTLLRRRVLSDIETRQRLSKQGEFLNMFRPVVGNIITSFNRDHRSVVIAVQGTEPVYAITGGTVVLTAWSPENGFTVQIQHSANMLSSYSNISRLMVKEGDIVGPGSVIGYVGVQEDVVVADSLPDGAKPDTGLLRFTLWHEGNAVDPENYILF